MGPGAGRDGWSWWGWVGLCQCRTLGRRGDRGGAEVRGRRGGPDGIGPAAPLRSHSRRSCGGRPNGIGSSVSAPFQQEGIPSWEAMSPMVATRPP